MNGIGAARAVVAASLLGLAALAAFWPTSPLAVERYFSRGVYARLQPAVTGLSNLCPFAWLDVAVAGAVLSVALGLWRVARRPRRQRLRALAAGAASIVAMAAVAYVAFLALWGLNYRRVPLCERLDFDRARVTDDATRKLAVQAIEAVNRLRDERGAVSGTAGDHAALAATLAPGFNDVTRMLGLPPVRIARPKVPLLTVYFNATGVSGMTNPFGLETLMASNLLAVEEPLVVAHEWAHLAGVGPESEATLVGFLVCVRGDRDARYSGWLDVTLRVLRALPASERRAFVDRLAPGVRSDIQAIFERNLRDRVEWLSLASWNIYDRYLKANRVPEGVRSYDDVVALLVGTHFGPNWEPAVRGRATEPH